MSVKLSVVVVVVVVVSRLDTEMSGFWETWDTRAREPLEGVSEGKVMVRE